MFDLWQTIDDGPVYPTKTGPVLNSPIAHVHMPWASPIT